MEAWLENLSEVHEDDIAFTPSPEAKEYLPQTTRTITPVITRQPRVIIRKVDPVCPPSARAAHITGTVVVTAAIGKDGRIKDAKIVSSPDDLLSAAALDAVRQWRYQPYTVNGEAMEIRTIINLTFAL